MKIMMKYKMSFSEADRLIEKYYDGMTTVDEEKQLQIFLSQADLPDRYLPEQAIFGYFNSKKQKPHFTIVPYIRWASVAAVVVFVAIGIQKFTGENQLNYAYVDGVKITNIQDIKSKALASLSDISAENNEVESGLKSMKDNELVEQQLEVFSGME